MVTGKNREEFEKWYTLKAYDFCILKFHKMPYPMRIGVYLDYCNSKGYMITVDKFTFCGDNFRFKINGSGLRCQQSLSTINEAYTEALKESNILINKFLKQ